MGAWANWLIPVIATLVLGIAASLYLRRIRLPSEEKAAGIAALAGMRWRDYIHLVLAALNKRGYERVFESDATGDESEYLLEHNNQQWLLSSKHGAAFVLGSTAIAEFANAIRMRGAAGGLLVTSGQFAPEAAALASTQRIQLLDGSTLWPELRMLLPPEQQALVTAPAQARAKRHVLMAWGGALVVGVLLFVLLPSASDTIAADASTPVSTAAPAPAPHQAITPTPPQPAVVPNAPIPTDPAELEKRRSDVARSISTLPMVDRAMWSTQSTLLVYLLDAQAEPMQDICPLLEHYDELGASRVQLQPPAGSTRPVRFLQCRAY